MQTLLCVCTQMCVNACIHKCMLCIVPAQVHCCCPDMQVLLCMYTQMCVECMYTQMYVMHSTCASALLLPRYASTPRDRNSNGLANEVGVLARAFMCVCMCVCMYVCVYVCVCIHRERNSNGLANEVGVLPEPLCVYVCVCVCVCVCMCVYAFAVTGTRMAWQMK